MANLSTLEFTSIVRNTVTAIQAGSAQLLNLTVGSVLRAIVEAIAGVILWLQGLITYVLTLTRFATSKGADADSWGADYGFVREGAVPATGQVTFTRFTTTTQSVIPARLVLQTGLQSTITENFDYDGTYDPGFFYVVVDNGSGVPPDQLITNVGNAIEAVRALGIRFAVFAPIVADVDVSLTITSAPGYDHPTV